MSGPLRQRCFRFHGRREAAAPVERDIFAPLRLRVNKSDFLERYAAFLRSFSSFLSTMLRFSREMWSMNSTPSR